MVAAGAVGTAWPASAPAADAGDAEPAAAAGTDSAEPGVPLTVEPEAGNASERPGVDVATGVTVSAVEVALAAAAEAGVVRPGCVVFCVLDAQPPLTAATIARPSNARLICTSSRPADFAW